MKNIVKMLNALQFSHTDTLQEKIIQQDGMKAMFATIEKAGLKNQITYKPGTGYVIVKPKAQK